MANKYHIGLDTKCDCALAEFLGGRYLHAERVAQLSGY